MIQVDANLFRLVYNAVSTDETRYYLNGVHIEAHPEKGAILVSTDGHRMIVANDEKGICGEKSAIVKMPKFALAQCKTQKMFTTSRVLEIDETHPGSATIVDIVPGRKPEDEPKRTSIITVHRVIVDGTFPDWRRVVPREAQTPAGSLPAAFNPNYLKLWGVLGAEFGDGGMQIALSNGAEPTVIRWGAAKHVFGIQMPLRYGGSADFLPAFMNTVPKEQLQAAE